MLDVNFQVADQTFSFSEGNTVNVTPDLSCSASGSTSVSFSIGNFNGASLPSWVAINSSNGTPTMTTPEVSSDSGFSFLINTAVTGVTGAIPKVITVTVKDCTVSNWKLCSSSSNSVWSTWNSNFLINSGKWIIEASSTDKTPRVIFQTLFSVTLVLIIFSSLWKLSRMSSCWSMINQTQLFYLLLVTRAFIPTNVKDVINGLTIAINPSNYILFENIRFYSTIVEYFDYNLSNSLFEEIDIQSDNIIFNMNSFWNLC